VPTIASASPSESGRKVERCGSGRARAAARCSAIAMISRTVRRAVLIRNCSANIDGPLEAAAAMRRHGLKRYIRALRRPLHRRLLAFVGRHGAGRKASSRDSAAALFGASRRCWAGREAAWRITTRGALAPHRSLH
jgi:hypothetical protein